MTKGVIARWEEAQLPWCSKDNAQTTNEKRKIPKGRR